MTGYLSAYVLRLYNKKQIFPEIKTIRIHHKDKDMMIWRRQNDLRYSWPTQGYVWIIAHTNAQNPMRYLRQCRSIFSSSGRKNIMMTMVVAVFLLTTLEQSWWRVGSKVSDGCAWSQYNYILFYCALPFYDTSKSIWIIHWSS